MREEQFCRTADARRPADPIGQPPFDTLNAASIPALGVISVFVLFIHVEANQMFNNPLIIVSGSRTALP